MKLTAANDVTEAGSGFGTDTNQITIVDASGEVEEVPLLSKSDAANRLLDRVAPLFEKG